MNGADRYHNFEELAAAEQEGVDFRRVVVEGDARLLVLAPHGGGIEPGTSEIARALSRDGYALYILEGLKREDNESLHITSTRFDDPVCLDLAARCQTALAVHGCTGDDRQVRVGGLHARGRQALIASIKECGFEVVQADGDLSGRSRMNICNRTRSGAGLQIEITEGLRREMFQSLDRAGRRHPTPVFKAFVGCLREFLGRGPLGY